MSVHSCADCQYEYPDAQFEQTPPDERRCPRCGGPRFNVRIYASTVRVIPAMGGSILITSNLWASWLRVAIEHFGAARRARSMAASAQPSDQASAWMSREFEAAIVAVSASAHSLDALYGSTVIPQAVRDQWRSTGTKRHGKIREALKQVFDTGAMNTRWVAEFEWLFDLRDAALHAEEKPRPPVPHPLGTNTAQENVDYSVESAERALDLAMSVLGWCVDHPRKSLPDAVSWASLHQPTLAKLVEERSNSTS